MAVADLTIHEFLHAARGLLAARQLFPLQHWFYSMATQIVAFIGGGQMAQALAGGAIAGGVLTAKELIFVEPDPRQQQRLLESFTGCRVTGRLSEGTAAASHLVLSVKPNILKDVAAELAGLLKPEHLVVSIAAGISLSKLQAMLGTQRVVRVMPNTPAQVGAGAAAIAADADVSHTDVQWVEHLFAAVGTTERVADRLMHAVTAVSGSGPAYVYLVIEALSDGGVAAGLPRDVATRLAAQTVLGGARMVLETGQHPGQLKDQVTSPGGTTIAALAVLEAAAVRGAFLQAVLRAAARSSELE